MDLGGYMRVSRKGDRDPDQWLTVPAQKAAITGWIDGRGYRLADLREDIDVSGGLDDRPNLEALVAQVEAGGLAGLVVAKVDRFSRDLAYGAMCARRIERAGGTFVAADDGVVIGPGGRDFGSNDTAHFLFAQLLSMADFFRRRTVKGWTQVRERHVLERGRHWGPQVPFGYGRGEGGRLVPDEVTGPLLAEAFVRRAGGEGCSAIARWLDGCGARTAVGGQPTHRWVKDLFTNRVYLGEARAGDLVAAGAHPALVDQGLFAAAGGQQRSRPRAARDPADAVVLSGLVRCWSCRSMMTGSYSAFEGGRRRVYRCRRTHSFGVCPGPAAAPEPGLLDMIEPAFWDILAADAQVAAARDDRGEGERLEAAADAAERSLQAYLATDFDGVDPRLIAAGARGHQQRLDEALAALSDWRRGAQGTPVDVGALRDRWPDLAPGVKNTLLGEVFGAVVVLPPVVRRHGFSPPLGGRVAALLVGDVPGDLPRRGGARGPDGRRGVGVVRSFPPFDDEAMPWMLLGE